MEEQLKQLLEAVGGISSRLEAMEGRIGEVQTSTSEQIGNILKEVDKKNSGLAASIERQNKKNTPVAADSEPEAEPEKSRLSLQSLQTKIQQMENEIKQRDQALFNKTKADVIRRTLQNKNVTSLDAAEILFDKLYGGNVKAEGDSLYVEQNGQVKELAATVEEFLQSDLGKTVIPASKIKGAGVRDAKPVQTGAPERSLNEMLLSPDF